MLSISHEQIIHHIRMVYKIKGQTDNAKVLG